METAALLRFSRDRRGYEYYALVQPGENRPAPGRPGRGSPRILYWFRTPPGVKVGRPPFDEEMQRAIEAQNPGVRFDWPRLIATPIPPPSAVVERWRERRLAQRAARAARSVLQTEREAEPDLGAEETGAADEGAADELAPLPQVAEFDVESDAVDPGSRITDGEFRRPGSESRVLDPESRTASLPNSKPHNADDRVKADTSGARAEPAHRRRRRRRRGRRKPGEV